MAFGCFLEVKGKALLLKKPYSLDIGIRKFKLDMTFIEPECGMKFARGEKQSTVLPCCGMYEPQKPAQ